MGHVRRIGVCVALDDEWRLFSRAIRDWPGDDLPVLVKSGPGAERARVAAEALVQRGVRGLLSFGYAGALDPVLKSGTLVIPDRIVGPDGTHHACDPRWQSALSRHGRASGPMISGTLASVDRPAVTARDKAALLGVTGAVAVDMESAALAAVAQQAGVAFAVLRAVCDEAGAALPGHVVAAIDADGALPVPRFLRTVLRHPGDLIPALKLAPARVAADRSLLRCLVLSGPGLWGRDVAGRERLS